jgi:hypothetical protein
MTQRLQPCLLLCLLMLALVPPSRTVMNDYELQPAVSNDPDYPAGLAAFERADWQGVIDNMAKVVARRPWRDNAYSLMGFASRKLGNYRRALEHCL